MDIRRFLRLFILMSNWKAVNVHVMFFPGKNVFNIHKDVRKFLISLEPDILEVETFQTKKPLTHPNILTIL